MRFPVEVLSLVTNVGTVILLLYFIKSAKEVPIRWLELLALKQDTDPLGPTEIRFHGGKLRQTRPILLDTLHVESAEDLTTQPRVDFIGWSGLTKKLFGAVHAKETT